MSKSKYNGKIGYVKNRDLGIRTLPNSGHYVYVSKDKGSKCDVNVVTSLEDINGNFDLAKINKVKKGYIYCIPKRDSNFTRWSGIILKPIKNVDKRKINALNNRKIKRRHKWFIGMFGK